MKASDFDFELDPSRIAQVPATPRDSARLLVARREGSDARHARVRDLPQILSPGDLLVLNDTRVLCARLHGMRGSGGAVEVLLAERLGPMRFRALVRPASRLKAGEELSLEQGRFVARMLDRPGETDDAEGASSPRVGDWRLELMPGPAADLEPGADPARDLDRLLEAHGRMPLPPYIDRERGGDPRDGLDRERYQTVFARVPGAIAAPTAGLHFTEDLLQRLQAQGIGLARVTLHVGEGTFKPVETDDVESHSMHAEQYELTAENAARINGARARGGRVIAIGTTSARTLETCVQADGSVAPGAGSTRLFLRPGAPLRSIDGLFTNFHLPRSTLLMLVSAFAGRERTLALYAEALREGYRFYSYGDAMLIH